MSRSLAVSLLAFPAFPGACDTQADCLQRQIYTDVLARWPKQDLRPDYQFQDVMRQVVDERFKNYKPSIESEEQAKARALQFLVGDKFKQQVCLPGNTLERGQGIDNRLTTGSINFRDASCSRRASRRTLRI